MPAPITTTPPAAPAAKPTTPAAPAQPDLAAQLAAAAKERDEYKAKYEGMDKKLRVNSIEMRKFTDEKRGLGSKLSEHSAFDAAFKASGISAADLKNFKVNPVPVLKAALGDGWYDKIVEMKLNGGAPTAEAVAAEIARAKSEAKEEAIAEVRGGFEKERTEREQKAREQAEQARAELTSDATAFLEKAGADYPVFEGYQRDQVARAIASYQEQQYNRTGKVLSTKEAADALEQAEVSRAERLAGIDKYRGKLTEKLKPANVPPVVGSRSAGNTQQERRTLSNDLTATTPQAKRAHRTDEERWAAINALDLAKST
jgi:hypothetical protein